MKCSLRKVIVIICIFITFNCFSQTNGQLVRDFVKGNIGEKTQLINSANADDLVHNEVWSIALEFINKNYVLLSDDEAFISLARTLVQTSSDNGLEMLLPQLVDLFRLTQNPALLLDLLTVFSSITTENEEIITLVNNYAQLLLEQTVIDEDMLLLTLEVLGNFESSSSFPILFQAYLFNEKEQISTTALQALSNLSGGSENQIRSLIETGSSREKYYTLQLVLNNSKNSDFFKAEMSEKALSNTIISIGDVSNVDTYAIDLQMVAIRELVRISWTRSADLITDFYLIAKSEFEANSLSEENFAEIISAFTVLSSGNAGEYLTEYLEELNRRKEENSSYSESIVFTVIQSLGLLGNKVAFDALLYTTYLDYPENIILAARDALVTLKW